MVFNKEALQNFIVKLDQEITEKSSLYLIGGASAILAYNAKSGTQDIDLWDSTKDLQQASQRVAKKFPHLKIHFGPAYVHIKSENMLKRFVQLKTLKLSKIKLMVPDPEDLFLLKAQRSDEKDLADLVSLKTTVKIKENTLLKRFKEDVLPLNYANDDILITNYLVAIEKVFGGEVCERHQKTLA